MKFIKILIISALSFAISLPSPASAHQPVLLLNSDTTAAKGPLLVDGTVSFAIRASFSKAREKKGFRAALNSGDQLSVQYLIVDKKPENSLKTTQFPTLVITAPSGAKNTIKFTERTKFFEPYGKTNYLYLARYSAVAESGIYNFLLTSRTKSAVTIAVGDREIRGEVLPSGALPVAAAIATPAPTLTATATPAPEPATTPTVAPASVARAS